MKTEFVTRPFIVLGVLLVSGVAAIAHAQERPRYAHSGPTLISDVRVIDEPGNEPSRVRDILLRWSSCSKDLSSSRFGSRSQPAVIPNRPRPRIRCVYRRLPQRGRTQSF